MDAETKGFLVGLTYAYLELLDKGIRDVCMPGYGVRDRDELDFMDEMAADWGQRSLTVRLPRAGGSEGDGEALREGVITYGKILHAPQARGKALALRRLLEKPVKNTQDVRTIGELLGYGPGKIEAYSGEA